MDAGRKDKLIRLERIGAETRSPTSRVVTRSWVLVENLWAKVDAEGGHEAPVAGQPAALERLTFTVGYAPGLSPSEELRIVYQGRAFDIERVEERGRRVDSVIHAVARAEKSVEAVA
jgi:head-tail adaptor